MTATLRCVLLLVLVTAGCARVTGIVDPPPASGSPWGRTYLSAEITEGGRPHPLVPNTRISLTLAGGQLSAYAGCNHLEGAADLGGGTLKLSGLGTTEIGCDQPLHVQDRWLAAFLDARPTWSVYEDELALSTGLIEMRLTDRKVADPDRPLQGTRWVVDTILDGQSASSVPAGGEAFVVIAGGRVSGSTGCNSLGGSAAVAGEQVTFTHIVATKRGCPGDRSRLESAVLRVLDGAVTVRVDADQLWLTHSGGRGLGLRARS